MKRDRGSDLRRPPDGQRLQAVTAAVTGLKHEREDKPGQDAVATETVGDTVFVAIADGAGSYGRSHHGARAAVRLAIGALKHRRTVARPGPLDWDLRAALHEVRRALAEFADFAAADDPSWSIKDLSCTLSIAVVDVDNVGIASVGDCVNVVRRSDGDLVLVAMAPETEIVNHTDFVVSDRLDEVIEVSVMPAADVEAILLSSDGLDLHLKAKRDGARWAISSTVNGLIDAPLLNGWGNERFEAFLVSDSVRERSDDDCSLAIVRPPVVASVDFRAGTGLEFTGEFALPSGRPAWLVRQSSGLVATSVEPEVPPGVPLRDRSAQIWDRWQRYPPVAWPIRSYGTRHILYPRPPIHATPLSSAVERETNQDRNCALLATTRRCVAALHEAGVSHGRLALDCFVVHDDDTVTLFDPGPGMFETGADAIHAQSDLAFLASLPTVAAPELTDGGPAAGAPLTSDEGRTTSSEGREPEVAGTGRPATADTLNSNDRSTPPPDPQVTTRSAQDTPAVAKNDGPRWWHRRRKD